LGNHTGKFGNFAVGKGRALWADSNKLGKWIILQVDREPANIVTNHEDVRRGVCASLRVQNARSVRADRNLGKLEGSIRLKSGDKSRSAGNRGGEADGCHFPLRAGLIILPRAATFFSVAGS
jgi:hypothetical protein